jgi:hypothetical protein
MRWISWSAWLDSPHLLPNESAKEFIQLFDYGKPQGVRDCISGHRATVLTWDILRYQQMKIDVLRNHQRPALESLLREIQVRTVSKNGIDDAFAQSEARQLAAPWFKDPASRPATMRWSRTLAILMIVVRDTGPLLVHAHNGGINHLHRRVMTGSQRIHDLIWSQTPACRQRTKRL